MKSEETGCKRQVWNTSDSYAAAVAVPRRSKVDVDADLALIEAGSHTTP